MIAELLPCPFCGGVGWIVEDRGDHGCEPLLYRPQCQWCGGGLGGFGLKAGAIAAWNTRAPPSARPDESLGVSQEAHEPLPPPPLVKS